MLLHGTTITERIIGCAIDVHKVLGPGLLESVYEEALCVELTDCELTFSRQVATYLRVLNMRVGLLLNFNVAVLRHGIRRVVV